MFAELSRPDCHCHKRKSIGGCAPDHPDEELSVGKHQLSPWNPRENLVKSSKLSLSLLCLSNIIPTLVSSSCMTARSAVLRLSQPALLEPCARGSSGQQDKAPVGRVHLRQVSRPLKASNNLNPPRGSTDLCLAPSAMRQVKTAPAAAMIRVSLPGHC